MLVSAHAIRHSARHEGGSIRCLAMLFEATQAASVSLGLMCNEKPKACMLMTMDLPTSTDREDPINKMT